MQKVSMHEWVEVASEALLQPTFRFPWSEPSVPTWKSKDCQATRAVPAHDARFEGKPTSMNPAQKRSGISKAISARR
jgi:hypothetical protein